MVSETEGLIDHVEFEDPKVVLTNTRYDYVLGLPLSEAFALLPQICTLWISILLIATVLSCLRG